jgi:hypothetical protein
MNQWKKRQDELVQFKLKLKQDFPILCGNIHSNYRDGGLIGFTIGNGWFDLVYKLSKDIENELSKMPKKSRPTLSQVKEKFGGLRWYMSHCEADDQPVKDALKNIESLIKKAENESLKTCEWCGKPGTSECNYKGYWIKVLCLDCHNKRENGK